MLLVRGLAHNYVYHTLPMTVGQEMLQQKVNQLAEAGADVAL